TTNGGDDWVDASFAAYDWDDVFFISDDVGWIMGEAGKIIKTTNGGLSWNYQSSGLPLGINSSYFISESIGWACGGAGYIIKTTNGGSTWAIQRYASTSSLSSIYFLNENLGWAVGYNHILKTTNGGNDWFDCAPTTDFMFAVKFVSPNIGFAVAGYGRIIKTTDGGSTWTNQTTPYTGWLSDISVFNENIACAVGDYGNIIKTTDGGSNWVLLNSNNSRSLTSVFFLNENIGYVAGTQGAILKTENGGLPVELISFNANCVSSDVTLSWSTASETNNKGFQVERRSLKVNSQWSIAGFVDGAGTTTELNNYSFTDENLLPGKYLYRLKQIDYDGSFKYSNIIDVEVEMPNEFVLYQNYPNPFNPVTKIKYTIPKEVNSQWSMVNLKVYDILGNEVATLVNEEQAPGVYEVEWNASSVNRGLASGVYFVRLQAGKLSKSQKIVLMK
ncbi:MAG: T9SS type A sorting domain-containing protein, partial [Ignavibacteriaceae bacterium]|nr:T9SS type A sorting domain-containing protein [Ignavibacteriaceae bacterium]